MALVTTKQLKKTRQTYHQFKVSLNYQVYVYDLNHGLRTPNEGINQRNLKFWADVAYKICFGHTYKFGIGI